MGWKKLAILSERFPYYDELEETFLPLLEELNVTVATMSKSSHAGVFDDEMILAMEEIRNKDVRIIVVNADRGAGKACWLHRYGFFGPNYVIFLFYWSDLYPDGFVPDNMVEWCTVDMVNEIIANSIVLGDSTIVDTFGKTMVDSSGISGFDWELTMEEKVENPKSSPFWGYWRMLPYDNILWAGYLLNSIETLLSKSKSISF